LLKELRSLGIVWGVIVERKKVSLEELRAAVAERDPKILESIDEIVEELYTLGLIDYEDNNIVLSNVVPDNMVEMPCIRCDRLSTCRIGARSDPFKCEKFVEWFIKNFSEHSL